MACVTAWLVALLLSHGTAAPAQAAVLGFIEQQMNDGVVTGLMGGASIAISPDGLHIYAGGEDQDALAVFSRDSGTGQLTFVGSGSGVLGLSEVRGVAVSPDGAHVYTVGYQDDAIAAFERDQATGALSFIDAWKNGVDGFSSLNGPQGVTVSPDGAHVYVASDVSGSVTVFSRDAATGELTWEEAQVDETGVISTLDGAEAVVVSADGAHVYVAAQHDDAVTGFSRDAATGALTLVTAQTGFNGLGRAQSVTITPDGAHVYVAGGTDHALAVFSRDAGTGVLSFIDSYDNADPGISGLGGVEWVTTSAGGSVVYAASDVDDALVVFSRDPATGLLTFEQVLFHTDAGVSGLDGASAVVASPTGPHVYVVSKVSNSVAVFGSLCGNGVFDAGEACDDGNVDDGDCCSSTCTVEPAGAVCADDGNVCTDDKCNGVGLCLHVNNTVPCDDGLYCTVNDVCANRVCDGEARDCSGADDVCNNGVCDDTADACVPQPKADGAGCDDANACTQLDACVSGACTGTNPVVCTPLQECEEGGVCDPATGQCSTSVSADGTSCDDGNACTQVDLCQSGVCVGTAPVACSPGDQCHDSAACDPATGICLSAAPNGTPCDDGDACTQSDTCQDGACTGANPVVCTALDQCHDAGTCNPATGVCSDPSVTNGTVCDDGDACTLGDTCQAGNCVSGAPKVCTALDGCHVPGVCDPGTGVCSDPAASDGTACIDGNACTQTDTCQTGVCVGGNPVACTAIDGCHDVGVCDTGTGQCSSPASADGSTCDDGDACTQTDACQGGVCFGANPVVCVALDQCHEAGVCDPSSGQCLDPALPDGTACDDASACTLGDSCQAGACVSGAPVVCTALDACHEAGVCDPATGICSDPDAANGTVCDDGNACTQTDACQSGSCVGANPIVCTAADQCHVAGVCDPTSGVCSDPAAVDGTSCDDGSLCSQTDTCQAGACVGNNLVVCVDLDQCNPGTCDPATGSCSTPPAADGTTCEDGDACTEGETCQSGVCESGAPVVCTALDECHDAGVCDPATGVCSNPAKPDPGQLNFAVTADTYTDADMPTTPKGAVTGDPDDTSELLMVDDRPQRRIFLRFDVSGISGMPISRAIVRLQATAAANAGSDLGGEIYAVSDNSWDELTLTHDTRPSVDTVLLSSVGAVEPSEIVEFEVTAALSGGVDGLYSFAVESQSNNMATYHSKEGAEGHPELIVFIGEECDDGDICTLGDVCSSGSCAGTPVVCTASDQCHDAGTCDGVTGLCSDPIRVDGSACDDGDACTVTDTCSAGACQGADPIICAVPDSCHESICDPATGVCPAPTPKVEGAVCDDGNACTQADTCQVGICVGAAPVVCAGMDDCHEPGVCDPATGVCSNPNAADGIGCDDGNACTLTDTCFAGVCTGANPVICTASDQCRTVGACDPATGGCSQPAKANGTACDDANACTRRDICLAGSCAGLDPLTCMPPDACHASGVCSPSSGVCSTPVRADGAPCDDGNACTQADMCIAGHCAGTDPIVCTSADGCHDGGTCDPGTGTCSGPAKADGTPCDDGDVCSEGDTCVAGECLGVASPDSDGDGICDLADVCRGVPDPAQQDADRDGVGDLCQCTAPAPGRCIEGGGSAKTDCLVELNAVAPVSFNRNGTRVKSTLRCADGDPACDMDGARDGQCTFGVSLCFGNSDPRLPRCTASMVESVEVLRPNPVRSTVARSLEDALGALGVEVRRRGVVMSAASQSIGNDMCTAVIRLSTPAPKKNRRKVVRRKVRLEARDEGGRRDTDRFVLECE
jgi:6-phosphogluconolactonase (cycloisomerase 2 family)